MCVFFFLIASLAKNHFVTDSVDVIELNHLVDGNAEFVLDQVIFWRWYRVDCRYHVVAWRRYGPDRGLVSDPPFRRRDQWVVRWVDGRDRAYREVSAPILRETWTQRDPEVDDREWLPQERRIGFTRAR